MHESCRNALHIRCERKHALKREHIDDEGTDFSEYDYMLADQKGLPTYIVNPRGELRKYDPNTATGHDYILIATNLPSDPNDPGSPKGCPNNTH